MDPEISFGDVAACSGVLEEPTRRGVPRSGRYIIFHLPFRLLVLKIQA